LTAGSTGNPWKLNCRIYVIATGSTGSVRVENTMYQVSAGGTTTVVVKFTTTTVNLTGGLGLVVKEQMATADAANTVHPTSGSIEQIAA
jgi:hypothetical protein